nr:MAG TPA: hypothetical protein [Caudoviricetes sp.]
MTGACLTFPRRRGGDPTFSGVQARIYLFSPQARG